MTSTETRRAAPANSSELAPIEWYRDPGLTEPTPVTITADGKIFGHIACWRSDHVGMPGRNVKPPRSRTDYSYYHVGSTMVSDGGAPTEISVGRLVQGTGHAPLTSDAAGASDWYDSTGSIVATVCAGEDEHGIWFSGSVAPGLDEVSLYRLRASAISGDWRVINNSLELTAALCVPSPGFPIPRARVASAADLVPIVAAGMVAPRPDSQEPPMAEQSYPEPTTPESLVAASPFGKGEPAPEPDDDGDGGSFGEGESALISGTNIVVQITGEAEDGALAFEGVLPADALEAADEAVAASAARRFTDGMQDRARDSRLDKLTSAIESLAASAAEDREARRSADAKLDEVLAKQRADEAERLIASAGLEA